MSPANPSQRAERRAEVRRTAERGGLTKKEKRLAELAERNRRHRAQGTSKHPLGDPREGEDRRQAERRVRTMTPAEVNEWLALNKISGGDRRQGGQRRSGGDRRRR